ncbi:MAG: CPBP family intramembrane metalloprotease [Gemmataceae bacterium]|nr:CPBP family intramembrane metalloprotease [Gemmataceae bacterium]
MSKDLTDPPSPTSPSHRWPAWAAWIVILAIVGFSVLGRELFVRSPIAREAANEGSLDLIAFQLQARYLVGVKHLLEQLKQDMNNADFAAQAKTVNVGRIPQRLRAIATLSELTGPEAALEELDALQKLIDQHQPMVQEADAQVIEILRTLWSDPDQHLEAVKSLTNEQRTVLNERLGWFGELVQHPRGSDPATREPVLKPALGAAFSILLAFLGAIALALIGIAVLVVFLMRAASGGLIRGFVAGSPNGRIYVETFGLWILLYPVLSFASGYASPYLGLTLAAALAMFASLLALAWPVIRGIPWQQVRSDIGWTAGQGGWLEPFWGVVAYVMTLPWLGVGLVLTILLIFLQRSFGLEGAAGDPFYAPPSSAHPIIVPLARGDLWDRLSIFFLASVAAPIVEETMFRGVFYRHLREATRHWRLLASFLFSALTSSVIFAAVHPQGWVAIPVLASLAFGFCVAREWRGSLIACMIAHGLSNGLVMLIAVAALG